MHFVLVTSAPETICWGSADAKFKIASIRLMEKVYIKIDKGLYSKQLHKI